MRGLLAFKARAPWAVGWVSQPVSNPASFVQSFLAGLSFQDGRRVVVVCGEGVAY